MHLLPAGTDGKQLDVFGCGFLCPAAEGIKPFFKRADIVACLERRVEPFFPACNALLLRRRAKARKAQVDRREESAVRRGVFVRFDGESHALCQLRHFRHLAGERRGDHVKAVDEDVLVLSNTGARKAAEHLARYVLCVAQRAFHTLFIGAVDFCGVSKLPCRAAAARAIIHGGKRVFDILRGFAAPLEIRNQRGDALRKAALSVFGGAAVHGQVFFFCSDDFGEHHAFAALIKNRAVGSACAVKHPILQPPGGQHIDQERALKLKLRHHLDFRLQRKLRGDEQHAALALIGKRADFADDMLEQPVRPCGDDPHGDPLPLFHVKHFVTDIAALFHVKQFLPRE